MLQRNKPRGPHGEEGAVLVIITLSLIALFGMMVLVVDVGSVLFARRAIVNAADAAALAAAQSCGKQEGQDEANLQAATYTVANQSGAAVVPGYPKYTPSCDNSWGFVRVRVTTERPLFFAPVLGFDSDTPVTFEAMAAWGGAGAGEKVAPMMLSSGRLTDCDIPPDNPAAIPAQGLICAFWWNNSPRSQPEDLTNAEWGTLDLNNWDVPGNDPCSGNPNPPDFELWMLTGFFEALPIHPPPTPTYVCKGVGNFGNSLNNIVEEAALRGDPLYFPVNDPLTQVDSGGGTCAPPPPDSSVTCSVHKYNIIGFAKLHIVGLYRGNTAESELYCGHIPEEERDSNARCMVARWTEYTPEGLNPQGGENFGLVPVRLVK